ncbi:MAG: glycosyl hydrolase [Chloroflexota bacterium]|nr:glycosyl hydrolase [Chloroflexota bacterium]MDQ5865912.1 glycosyl hydrolase [Chloroflexota bacterium]
MSRFTRAFTASALALLVAASVFSPTYFTTNTGVPTTQAAAAYAPDPGSPFGIAGVMRWPDWGTFSRPADAFMETGASWVREDFAWGLIQPTEQRYEWTATDRIVGELATRKVNVLGIISYSVNWATPSKEDDKQASALSFYPPDHEKYAHFVRTLVSRYKGTVKHWEIWNEPDNSMFWKPKPNAREYAELLKVAYKAVKQADPTAKVLSGGVSGNAVPYLEEMMAAGAGGSFDILALHPYAVPLNAANARVESRPEVHKMVDVELTKYRAFLERHGIKRPVWVTEMGWPALDWGLDEAAQADYMAQAYAQMLASGLVERIFWYSFKDDSGQPTQTWGMLGWGAGKTDLAPRRASFGTYATLSRVLKFTKPGGRFQLGQFTVVEGFESPATWQRSFHTEGTMLSATGLARDGTGAGKLEYNFDAPNQAVDFAPDAPRLLPGSPTRLGLWVKGDNSGNYLSAWLKDKDGELFKVRLGAVSSESDGWRYYESRVNNYYFDWERAGGNPPNGKPDYPLHFVGFRLENTPDEPPGKGTVLVDDLQSYDGPDVSAVRFTRADGQVVDVLWSVDPTGVQLATGSSKATVVDRNGKETQLPAKDGALSLKVSSSPIYVVHKPGQLAKAGESPGSGATGAVAAPPKMDRLPMCASTERVEAAQEPGNRYFPETGHNLGGVFRQYWESHGGVEILGYPLTEVFTAPSSDGKSYRQQYFERARLEHHPENAPPYDVQVGLLGTWLTEGRTFPSTHAPTTAGEYFPLTGQSLGLFQEWWRAHGGLAVFGYPISAELQERNDADGKTYTVQYFERNRLEYHPEHKGTNAEVLLGLLGVEYLNKQGCK